MPTCQQPVITRGHLAWTTQRIANRLPGWSRARERLDSVLQAIVNPFAQEFDNIYSREFIARSNYYVSSTDTNAIEFSYLLNLPMEFSFERTSQGVGEWIPPTITGILDSVSIPITVSESWLLTDKFESEPTRITVSQKATGILNTLLATSFLDQLSSNEFNNAQLLRLRSKLWLDIDGAESFGGETSDGDVLVSKIIINGQPLEFDYLDEKFEHIKFPTNDQLPSRNVYDAVWSITTSGINNPETTTLTITRGFNKDFILEPYALWVTPDDREQRFGYELISSSVNSQTRNFIRFSTAEYPITFQEQGFSSREAVYESLIVDGGNIIGDLVDIERMPFSLWLLAINQTKLFLFSSMRSNFTYDILSSLQEEFLSLLYTSRTPNPELLLESDRNWMHSDDLTNGISIYTHHKGSSEVILSTRLSQVVQDSTDKLVTTYLDWSGNEIDISLDPNLGFIMNESTNSHPEGWTEKTLTINPMIDHPDAPTAAIYILETKLAGGQIQKDALLIYVPVIPVVRAYDLPASITNRIVGMTYDGEGNLLLLLTDSSVWELVFHYDYSFIDYRQNTIYLRESYDSVDVVT